MRGLMRAARFLAPALATVVVAADLARAGTSDPAALIQLDIPDLDANTYGDASLLRLDVLESAEPCGYGNVTLNDQTLDQDGDGHGSGSLILEEGSTFMARWNFTCVDVDGSDEQEQLMEVAVDLMDGNDVKGLKFAVRFKQTNPIQVVSVDGVPSVITTPRHAAGHETDEQHDSHTSELERLRVELERMTQQKLALEKVILDKQQSFSAETSDCHVKASTKLRKCHSPRCLVSTMYHRIKNAAGIDSQDSCSEEHGDESPIRIAYHGKEKERPLVATSDESLPPPQYAQYDTQQQSSHSDASESKWRRIKSLLIFLPAIVMIIFIAIVLGVKHSKSTTPDDAEKQARRHERRAARRQAQEERRAAFQASFDELRRRFRERFALRSSNVEDEEKDAVMRQVHVRGDDDAGSESDSDASTTMEQELASFRNIADVVGSMVTSAAQGRPRAHEAQRPASPKLPHHHQPRRPGYAFSDCGSVDEELPSYDEGVTGASHVADGFRYTPGGHHISPLTSPLNDVLGSKD